MEIRLEQPVTAPPAVVWRVLTDIDAAAQNMRGVVRVERLSQDVGYDVGTRWLETRRILGSEATEELWVTAVEEGRSTEIAAVARGMQFTTLFTLVPAEGGTLLTMTFTSERDNPTAWSAFVGRVAARLGAAASRRMMAQDLADIAAAAEALV